jgi:excisionase family DNA binding protein
MPNSKSLLTPKELAEVIGASESSLRRWVDGGRIRKSRTTGGHRRIPLAEAVRFIRESGATVVRPEILGLTDLVSARGGGVAVGVGDEEQLFEALRAGDARMARGLVLSWYLSGRGLAELFDGPVRGAMRRVGELWRHDARGILVEHRATEICAGTVDRLGELLPEADGGAPLAVGGAPEGDPYVLPTRMAGMVLGEAGLGEVNFGANTPVELLGAEAVRRRARLVWLSVSFVADDKRLRGAVGRLAGALAEQRIDLVVGGVHAADVVPRTGGNVRVIESMGELAAFARGLPGRPRDFRTPRVQ